MNMGVVARLIYDNYVCDGVQGRYVIEYYAKPVRHGILILRFKKSILYIWKMESEVGLFVTYTGREQYVLSGIYLNLIFRIKENQIKRGWLPSTP